MKKVRKFPRGLYMCALIFQTCLNCSRGMVKVLTAKVIQISFRCFEDSSAISLNVLRYKHQRWSQTHLSFCLISRDLISFPSFSFPSPPPSQQFIQEV